MTASLWKTATGDDERSARARSAPSPRVLGGMPLLNLPFDAMRFQYASAVRSGVIQRSSLASGRWERSLDALERLLLGPWARQR